jgi:hypothetical protein
MEGKVKKKFLAVLAVMSVGILVLSITTTSHAALIQIGTATYASATNAANNVSLSESENVYKLIYDDVMMITWLDYSNTGLTHSQSLTWANTLGSDLTINLFNGYSESWGSNAWRLPSGNASTGYNITTSELGNLYYNDLGNVANDASLNFGIFDNIKSTWVWSDYYEGLSWAWAFNMGTGQQAKLTSSVNSGIYEMGVISGEVSLVPIPGAIWLLGSGLIGLIGFRRYKNT